MVAMATTSAAVILLIYGAYQDSKFCLPWTKMPELDFDK